jgi:hypothetical protein
MGLGDYLWGYPSCGEGGIFEGVLSSLSIEKIPYCLSGGF